MCRSVRIRIRHGTGPGAVSQRTVLVNGRREWELKAERTSGAAHGGERERFGS